MTKAAVKAASSRNPRRSGNEEAYAALVRYLSNGRYWHKADIEQRLRDDGFTQQCDYVMTKARRFGNVVVLGPERSTYSSKPAGIDVLKDLRKRRRVSFAWIRNVQAVASYTLNNWGRVTAKLDSASKAALKAEVAYIQRMVPHMLAIFKKAGLS